MSRRRGRAFRLVAAAVFVCAASAATYEVGPDKPYKAIGEAPWASLQPGDTVLIHWRPEPYREKFVICRQGSENAPITVSGVPGPEGQLPHIEGSEAQTPRNLNYWNEERGIIKVGGANIPPDTMPRHIVIENLEISGARPPHTFVGRAGTRPYAPNAAAIYVEKAEHLTIRNTILRDSANGLFIGSSNANVTRDVLVESNYIHGNGSEGDLYVHNSYTEALGIVFQFNRYGPLREGTRGNNLKDRSGGQVVRYNWIEGGNRQLDLVDAGAEPILRSPAYRATFVYGNVLVEPDGAGNRQIIHYGGDSAETGRFRKGSLHLFHNTVVSYRVDRTTLVRLSTNEENADIRNNIVYTTAPGTSLSLVDSAGVVDLSRNWMKPGWVLGFDRPSATLRDDRTGMTGASPGFADEGEMNFHLAEDSPCIDAGAALAEAALPDHQPAWHYVKHRGAERRLATGAPDLGAFERMRPAELDDTERSP